MNNLPITIKMGLGFGVIVVFLLVLGYIGDREMGAFDQRAATLIKVYSEDVDALSNVNSLVARSMVEASMFTATPTQAAATTTNNLIREAIAGTNKLDEIVNKIPSLSGIGKYVADFHTQLATYSNVITGLQTEIFKISDMWNTLLTESVDVEAKLLVLDGLLIQDYHSGYRLAGNADSKIAEKAILTLIEFSRTTWPQNGVMNVAKMREAVKQLATYEQSIISMKENFLNTETRKQSEICVVALNKIEVSIINLCTAIENRDALNTQRATSYYALSATYNGALDYLEKNLSLSSMSETGEETGHEFFNTVAKGSIIISIIIAAALSYLLSSPIKKCATFAQELAKGHVIDLDIHGRDEIAKMAEALRAIPHVLDNIIESNAHILHQVTSGELNAKGDASKIPGRFADLINTTNALCNRFLEIIEAVPSAVVVLNANERVCYVNKIGRDIVGNDFYGKTCGQVMAREDYATERCGLANAVRTLKPTEGETKAHPRGQDLTVRYFAVPMFDKDKKLACILQLIIDVTEARRIQQTIIQVAQDSSDVAQRVASTAEQLSAQMATAEQGTSMVSVRIEEAATAMDEMNNTVTEVAHSAGNASNVANEARTKADNGAKVVESVVKSIGNVERQSTQLKHDMVQLGQQAESIGTIMNVISDIADQTNLLALNAAIEAARAGEAGRGFAVVADEVRKLAEKTMQATVEVGDAIRNVQNSVEQNMHNVDASVSNIATATEQAREAGTSLEEIVTLVDTSADQIRAIATAAEEQSVTSDEISRTLVTVTTASSETAVGMQESAQAVNELAGQAGRLNELIAQLQRA